MRSPAVFLIAGTGGLVLAAIAWTTGTYGPPWVALVALPIAAGLLLAGLVRARRARDATTPAGPVRGEGPVLPVAIALGGLAAVAIAVASTVAIGEARGHATSHLVAGLLCLALFCALAFPWRPARGTAAAAIRGLVLLLLAVAATGSFVESLGGAGYDAANQTRRIAGLARLHDVALPFSGLVIAAVPLAAITSCVVVVARVVGGRHR